MSVPQAMEWLIEHAEDPTIDAPLPGRTEPPTGTQAPSTSQAASAGPGSDEEARDELTDIFKRIRRKREFRADGRVSTDGQHSYSWALASWPPHTSACQRPWREGEVEPEKELCLTMLCDNTREPQLAFWCLGFTW